MKLPGIARKARERFDEQRRTGDVTVTSLLICAGIVLYAVYKSFSGN